MQNYRTNQDLENACGLTLAGLIDHYKADPESTWHSLRYHVRQGHEHLMRRLVEAYGNLDLSEIDTRDLKGWHRLWTEGGKIATGSAFMGKLRTLMTHGALLLPNGAARDHCRRIKGLLKDLRFAHSPPRTSWLTADQCTAIRERARDVGWYSIALAQAMQFELLLRQRDIIGEYVPISEPGVSDVVHPEHGKWLRGIRWSEIGEDLILRHVTSKRQKELIVNLQLAPMVMSELKHTIDLYGRLPQTGPVITYEGTAMPYLASEYRRKWRIIADDCGVPKGVFNMDSRSGGISEATDAGADIEHVRHAATHSDISMTQRYSRSAEAKIAQVMQQRVAHRNKQGGQE